MTHVDFAEQLSRKGADTESLVECVIADPQRIGELVEGLKAPKGTLRYGYEKLLRRISERRGDLIYPWFDTFTELLDCDNSFIKWGAILTIGHLTRVDTESRFEAIFDRYYAPIGGPVMITAANIVGSSAQIAQAKPHLIDRIVVEILKVEKGRYLHKGELSPECRNVVIGHAIDVFDTLFDMIEDKSVVLKFVRRQLGNSRVPVAGKAARFLKVHSS